MSQHLNKCDEDKCDEGKCDKGMMILRKKWENNTIVGDGDCDTVTMALSHFFSPQNVRHGGALIKCMAIKCMAIKCMYNPRIMTMCSLGSNLL